MKDTSLCPGIYKCPYHGPLGDMTLASDGERIVGLWFDGQRYYGSTLSQQAVVATERREFQQAVRWLDIYFSGNEPGPFPAICFTGTPFRKKVWQTLMEIPRGVTVTYGTLASCLGSSPRAVGGAVGHNPISIIVPCHRVTGYTSLTGYAAGLVVKRHLLNLEGLRVK